MTVYLQLGHIELITDMSPRSNNYYIPHHYVFNATVETSSGHSLNDTPLTGPKLQPDISAILLQFRLNPIELSCEIKEMFSQIISPSYRDHRRIS